MRQRQRSLAPRPRPGTPTTGVRSWDGFPGLGNPRCGRRRPIGRVGNQQALPDCLAQRGFEDREAVADRPRRQTGASLVILAAGPLELAMTHDLVFPQCTS
jgi:hypothetical protein